MRAEVEGRASRGGFGARSIIPNKESQFLPRALGCYTELFDFPIHYFLRTQAAEVGPLLSVEEELQRESEVISAREAVFQFSFTFDSHCW